MQKFFSSCSGKHFYPFFPYPVQTEPRFELHCSSDVVHIRTCSDSCAALMNLIQYIASYGDLHAANRADMKPGAPQRKMKVQLPTSLLRTHSALPHASHMSGMFASLRSAWESWDGREPLSNHLSVPYFQSGGVWKGDSVGLFGKLFYSLIFFVSGR